MEIKIETKKYGVVVNYKDPKNLVLLTGARVAPMSASLDVMNRKLRDATTTIDASGKIITTADIVFKSTSACASFIVGSPQSGVRFFAKYLLSTTTSSDDTSKDTKPTDTKPTDTTKTDKQRIAESVIAFCKDFAFNPDPRCLNNMRFVDNVNEYILNFMELTNYPTDMLDRAKRTFESYEWKNLIKTIKGFDTKTQINQRLIIKYGAAGTGKTTDAIAQYPQAVKIVASASADPDDLFTRFEPSKKCYVLTELGQAMQEGKPIIVDEANLYNQVVLTRMQGCLDNTPSVMDRGIEIKIAEGFKVIMTMNLETNLGKTPLPNPLVSRAQIIENYDNRQDLSWVW